MLDIISKVENVIISNYFKSTFFSLSFIFFLEQKISAKYWYTVLPFLSLITQRFHNINVTQLYNENKCFTNGQIKIKNVLNDVAIKYFYESVIFHLSQYALK